MHKTFRKWKKGDVTINKITDLFLLVSELITVKIVIPVYKLIKPKLGKRFALTAGAIAHSTIIAIYISFCSLIFSRFYIINILIAASIIIGIDLISYNWRKKYERKGRWG